MRRAALLAGAAAALLLSGCGVPADGSDGVAARTAAHSAVATAPPHAPLQLTEARPVGIIPVRVQIPSARIDVPVVPVGETPSGDLAVPTAWGDAGWWQGGYRPGQLGSAVIAGHLDTDDAAHPHAAFSDLHTVVTGAEVLVTGADGSVLRFSVHTLHRDDVDRVPLGEVFGPSSRPELTLLTCAGVWRGKALGYSQRLAVTAVAEAP